MMSPILEGILTASIFIVKWAFIILLPLFGLRALVLLYRNSAESKIEQNGSNS